MSGEIILGKAQQKAFDAAVAGHNSLISGQGGTGKSLVIQQIVEFMRYQLVKNVKVTASTGMAAVALDGTTIHSFLGTGLACSWTEAQNMTYSDAAARAQDRLMATDVVVCDEVSMLTGDYIDMTDKWCRILRQQPDTPFGGLQFIWVGDFLQLPPVVRNKVKWRYAFQAPIWNDSNMHCTTLGKSYRQEDQELVAMLKRVRFGSLDSTVLAYFNQRVGIDFGDDVPQLHAKNVDADAVNADRLVDLPGEMFTYRARFEGYEPAFARLSKMLPVPEELELKVGAPILFRKNNHQEGYFNGDRGIVTSLTPNSIFVDLIRKGLHVPVQAPLEEWHLQDGDGRVVCTARQFPITLAWAITQHKAQGMTLDQVYVNTNACFETGQAYTALSRVRSLEGLSLLRPMRFSDVRTSGPAVDFYRRQAKARKAK